MPVGPGFSYGGEIWSHNFNSGETQVLDGQSGEVAIGTLTGDVSWTVKYNIPDTSAAFTLALDLGPFGLEGTGISAGFGRSLFLMDIFHHGCQKG